MSKLISTTPFSDALRGPRESYEYRTEVVPFAALAVELNKVAAEGWRCIGTQGCNVQAQGMAGGQLVTQNVPGILVILERRK